jgi:hypothetical protein
MSVELVISGHQTVVALLEVIDISVVFMDLVDLPGELR